jgi:hypothetical protein
MQSLDLPLNITTPTTTTPTPDVRATLDGLKSMV